MIAASETTSPSDRILSVDFFRGFTMFLLVANFAPLFHGTNPVIAFIGRQLDHADWEGLNAWDLVQPFFMFIVGVAMPFSFAKRWARGDSWNKTLISALRRSVLLLFLGWLIGSDDSKSSYTNVLAQLSVTYFISFLLMRKSWVVQLLVSIALIILTDVIYRTFSVEGFNHPFMADHNFGSWVDIALTGGLSEDRWVAFNAIPTTAHTIWGVMAGTLLMKAIPPMRKVAILAACGVAGIVGGYALGMVIPIIKRVCTSSFIVVSGGWALLALAVCYLVIDVYKKRKGVFFFAVVGMNPLFIYLFMHAGGRAVLQSLSQPVTHRMFRPFGGDAVLAADVLVVAAMIWYMCYFLYRRKIFIRI